MRPIRTHAGCIVAALRFLKSSLSNPGMTLGIFSRQQSNERNQTFVCRIVVDGFGRSHAEVWENPQAGVKKHDINRPQRYDIAMSVGGHNMLYPRRAVPPDIGRSVRLLRLNRRWSQAKLAQKIDVNRRTILRLELGLQIPGSALVHALERVFGLDDRTLVPAWHEATPASAIGARGPRALLARKRLGLTLREVSRSAGISVSTLSRFEREMSDGRLIFEDIDRGNVSNVAYALALGFSGANEMTEFLESKHPETWLQRRDEGWRVKLFC